MSPPADAVVLEERDTTNGVAVLKLSQPPVNALDAAAFDSAELALRELSQTSGIRAIVLTGGGTRAFCAGTDLAAFETPAALARVQQASARFFTTLAELPVPLVGALNGPAVGGGAMIASECDVLVAVPDAWFALPEVAAGLLGGGSHARRLAPYFKGLRMLLLGERLSAQEALESGVLAAVVEPHELRATALEWARRLAALDPAALRAARAIYRAPEAAAARDGYADERVALAELLAERAAS